MSNKQRGLLAVFVIVVSTLLISACTQSLSAAPAATPTLLPTGLFVSPFPSVENPMAMIEEFAKQTAAAQTVAAGGTPGTSGTPQAVATTETATLPAGTVITPQTGVTATPGVPTTAPSTPTNANAVPTTPVAAGTTPVASNSTAVPAGVRPATYVLNEGEWPYCIARRFDVDPDALLSASGLTSPDIYYEGLKLTIPQTGSFPGKRNLVTHPVTYTVKANESIYSIACDFGDVTPEGIIAANGFTATTQLTPGQQIKIP
ncbi:MAG: LysM peptidoglycan-binding domain-containing protein [Anaerolineales bacterium]|uniref:LysM peptidoglycan-binding domain-containing protein n=1 Tax=Candidatus Villigracilis vicinus TaxID=3140679 RepID=UPI0031367C60|nr:LysM peptidoglycan-binding domain-containing protein [Anaerolineales bacterium]